MVAWHRALACLTRHSKTLIHLSRKGTKSFWILRFLSDQAILSVRWSCGTWPDTWTCKVMRCWDFERWTSHASLMVCFQLSVQVVRCYSHLTQPCEVFHSWGGKACGMLINRSRDVRPESGDTIGVVTSTEIGKCVWSQDIQLESYLPIGVTSSDWCRAYDQSRIFLTGVRKYLHYKHV
jgi:hypothetical protein